MGFSQSNPQYLLTSAFTEVGNPSPPLLPGHCTMSCCQAPTDNKLLIFNWGNSTTYKTKQSQTYLSIGTGKCFSFLLEDLRLLIRLHPSVYIFGRQALHSTRRCAPLYCGAEHDMVYWHLLRETEFDRNLEKVGFRVERQWSILTASCSARYYLWTAWNQTPACSAFLPKVQEGRCKHRP